MPWFYHDSLGFFSKMHHDFADFLLWFYYSPRYEVIYSYPLNPKLQTFTIFRWSDLEAEICIQLHKWVSMSYIRALFGYSTHTRTPV